MSRDARVQSPVEASADPRITAHDSPAPVTRPAALVSPQTTPADVERVESRPVSDARPVVDVSVLVPAKDEVQNLPLFLDLAAQAFAGSPWRYEVIVVDDGSVDDSWAVLQELKTRFPFLRTVRHRTQRGIADALRTGYLHARGAVLVFYPADLQFKPEDIPRLVAPIVAGEFDMVTGYKEGHYEKAFVSRVYNRLSRALFDVPVRDLNSVKAYRREVMEHLPIRPDWHRYMIVLAHAQGFSVHEIPVPVYPRHAGRSKFGVSRIPVGVLDMLSVWFELRFAQKPLLLFGMLGAALFALGVLSGLIALGVLVVSRVGVRAVWTVITTCLTLGSIFFAAGLLGEQIAGQRAQMRELRRQLDELRSDGRR
jgi:glycosyl transferase family 2